MSEHCSPKVVGKAGKFNIGFRSSLSPRKRFRWIPFPFLVDSGADATVPDVSCLRPMPNCISPSSLFIAEWSGEEKTRIVQKKKTSDRRFVPHEYGSFPTPS